VTRPISLKPLAKIDFSAHIIFAASRAIRTAKAIQRRKVIRLRANREMPVGVARR
jgi:hypothetical protein